jgi:hypothetical protein
MPSKKKAAAAPRLETSTVRWTDEDRALIERLQKKTGIRSVTELLRKALRDAAVKEGL